MDDIPEIPKVSYKRFLEAYIFIEYLFSQISYNHCAKQGERQLPPLPRNTEHAIVQYTRAIIFRTVCVHLFYPDANVFFFGHSGLDWIMIALVAAGLPRKI